MNQPHTGMPVRHARPPHRQPRLSGEPSKEGGARVLRHAAELLLPRIPAFAESALTELCEASSYYGNPLLAPPDLRESAHTALECFVGGMVEPSRMSESGEYAWHTGGKRAEEGVPLQAVLHAYRVGGAEIWDTLVGLVMRDCPEQGHLMAFAANEVWGRVDRDTALVVEAHRRTADRHPEDDGRKQLPLLKVLLRGYTEVTRVSAIAVALGLPLHARYAVALLCGSDAERSATDPAREVRDGMELHWCPQEDGLAVVALLGDRSAEDLAAAMPTAPGLRGGVSTVVSGLMELGRAREFAQLALNSCSADGEVARLADRLPGAFILARPDLAQEFAAQVLGPVLEADPVERDQLLATLAAWLDCQGSTGEAGKRLYCHRNTVLNRLRRLERLTGRLLARPRDVVDLAFALESHRLTSRKSS
ncbi:MULTISPECIES: CdaR family transcriptional regulator [unclassified Streptomyces]|uniref:PucR family transcriptional regulator n=1 Tax=unclassified Streptomyces TaxID=2593676 RepID=UPI0022548BE1|nr:MULTISPECIES: helix-turn-helix domain-containing protein [unclassified Streptomyces]MCX5144140.1 helix-turn-helix domain-containing protein [Streptomyces sp. NBC_00338]WRZ68516.1 helix-turn-helix domain-containing protein [Streptomyces sp. NBC_01257]